MTMQKQDYERIAFTIRAVRDEAIEASVGTGEYIANVTDALRTVAVELACEFLAVNPRFKVNHFLLNAVGGGDEGVRAMEEFDRMKENEDGRHQRGSGGHRPVASND